MGMRGRQQEIVGKKGLSGTCCHGKTENTALETVLHQAGEGIIGRINLAFVKLDLYE